MSQTPTLLQLEGISKRFGATLALDDVSFDLRPGEVHALMGENGAGKSTLMKILAGNEARDSGRILIDGMPVEVASPTDAATHGIAIIHQELNTVPSMTVAENLALGREPTSRFGTLDRKEMLRSAKDKLARIQSDIDPRRELGSLSIGMQQMVEIARAVSEKARILVLDEPTAALSRTEAQHLYQVINDMRRAGVGLIYISHRMEETWELADRVTVFRDGRYVGTRATAAIVPADVVRMMVGRDLEDLYHRTERTVGPTLLDVKDLSDGASIGPVTFQVRAGEVVCMAGLIGAGRTEVARMIFGADRPASGSVTVNGRAVDNSSPQKAIRSGLGMLPESRKEQALFLDHSVEDNITVSSLDDYALVGHLRRGALSRAARAHMERLRLRLNAIQLPVRALSGGNQQKAVLARWLMRESQVIILDEPTRGVDIGAKSEIYKVIDELASAGRAILIVSSDLPEALGISDRVLVMKAGRLVRELDSRTASEEDVMFHATGTSGHNQGESDV